MKLFGWGKSKEPQPQACQQVSTPDPRSGGHGLDRCASVQPGMGSIMRPGKGSSMRRQQQGLFDTTSKAARSSHCVVNPEADSEEKLQDKIRFVFSHEQEGLLAIGTFALEQLQSIRNTIDGRGRRGGNAAAANADPAAGDHQYGFGSEEANLLALANDVMQSSDDEDQLQRSWLAARQTCDLPVFGDTSEDAVDSDAEQAPLLRPAAHAAHQLPHDDSKALTLYKGNSDAAETTATPIFMMAPELRSALRRPFLLPHWTDSVPPPGLMAKVEQPGPVVDDDYYSTRLCGLFNKRIKSLKSKRMATVPAVGDENCATRIIPIEKAAHGHEVTKRSSSSLLKFDGSMPSLGKLAKLWRATCTPSSTARITPERKPSPQAPAFKVAPCGPKACAEGRRRVQAHERMMDNHGHWIKDDEDFVVLEM